MDLPPDVVRLTVWDDTIEKWERGVRERSPSPKRWPNGDRVKGFSSSEEDTLASEDEEDADEEDRAEQVLIAAAQAYRRIQLHGGPVKLVDIMVEPRVSENNIDKVGYPVDGYRVLGIGLVGNEFIDRYATQDSWTYASTEYGHSVACQLANAMAQRQQVLVNLWKEAACAADFEFQADQLEIPLPEALRALSEHWDDTHKAQARLRQIRAFRPGQPRPRKR